MINDIERVFAENVPHFLSGLDRAADRDQEESHAPQSNLRGSGSEIHGPLKSPLGLFPIVVIHSGRYAEHGMRFGQ